MKPKPTLWVGSSTLDLAYAVKGTLKRHARVTVWPHGFDELSRHSLPTLTDALQTLDFAVFVFSKRDLTRMRDSKYRSFIVNVAFVCGLLAGNLGIDRCFILVPEGTKDLGVPIDHLHVTLAAFRIGRTRAEWPAALRGACNRIRKSVLSLGPQKQPRDDYMVRAADLTWPVEGAARLRVVRLPKAPITPIGGKSYVFISYSQRDQIFADRLRADLEAEGIPCWLASNNMRGGKKVHEQIEEAIRGCARLLLILSKHSMGSEWVKTEIALARKKERQEKRQVLLPVGLVPFEKIRAWKCFDADTGKDTAREIREYFIPDFSDWEAPGAYQRALEQLLSALDGRSGRP